MRSKKTDRFLISLLGILILLIIVPFSGYAAVPQTINYQGYITDSGGTPIDATVQMTFKIYNVATGGTALWTEIQPSVTVSDGIYSVVLGSVTPLNLTFDTQYYLGVEVGTDGEMTPRQLLTSVPYAFSANVSDYAYNADTATDADTVDGKHAGDFAAADHNHDSDYVNDDAGEVGNADVLIGALSPDRISDTAWTSANDGSGSGLDADLFDGQESSAFMSASTDLWVNTTGDTMSGTLNLSSNGLVVGGYQLVASGGNIGIGTTSPTATLQVNSSNTGGAFAVYNASWSESYFFVDGATGNVGMGTTSPSYKLDVEGGTGSAIRGQSSSLGVEGFSTSGIGVFGNTGSGVGVGSYSNDGIGVSGYSSSGKGVEGSSTTGYAGWFEGPKNYFSGKVGIGTTGPAYPLDVAGEVNLNKGVSSGVALRVNGDEALWYNGTYFSWGYGGTTNYFADKVGIGMSNPSRKLWVNGDAGGTTAWYNDSDFRLKKDVQTIDNAIEKVQKLRGIYFSWNDTVTRPEGRQIGMIAQEVIEVVPEVVQKKGEYYSMATANIVALLVEAIKEQQAEIEELRARLNERQ